MIMTAVSKHVSGPLRQVQPHASETTAMHEAVVDLWRSAHVIAAASCQHTSKVSYLLQTLVGLNDTQDLDQTPNMGPIDPSYSTLGSNIDTLVHCKILADLSCSQSDEQYFSD